MPHCNERALGAKPSQTMIQRCQFTKDTKYLSSRKYGYSTQKGEIMLELPEMKAQVDPKIKCLHQTAKNLFSYFCIQWGLGVAHAQNS